MKVPQLGSKQKLEKVSSPVKRRHQETGPEKAKIHSTPPTNIHSLSTTSLHTGIYHYFLKKYQYLYFSRTKEE